MFIYQFSCTIFLSQFIISDIEFVVLIDLLSIPINKAIHEITNVDVLVIRRVLFWF